MFSAEALRGFINQVKVDMTGLTGEQAKALMVRTAVRQRDRVIGESRGRSGFAPGYRQIVDGVEAAPFEAVRPDGVIVLAWEYLAEVAEDTRYALVRRSPRQSGRFISSIKMLLDGTEGTAADITPATHEVQLVAAVEYARRLEVGKRKSGGPFVQQVPWHFVEETMIVQRRLFGELAAFQFGMIDLPGAYSLRRASGHRRRHGRVVSDIRYPAITITARTA